MKHIVVLALVSVLAVLSLACAGQPQTAEVVREVPINGGQVTSIEVTSIVPQTVQVEVTRLVPQTVEVTRVVQRVVTATPRPATPTPQPTNTPETPKVGKRANPVPVGETFGLVLDQKHHFKLVITQVFRGEEAWSRILAANRYNDPAPEGMEYLLVYAEVDYAEGPGDEALDLDQWDFKVVSKGQVLDVPSVVEPEPEFDLALFPGARSGGWMSWQVYVDDPEPALVVGLESGGRGGFYFATQR